MIVSMIGLKAYDICSGGIQLTGSAVTGSFEQSYAFEVKLVF